MAKFVGDREAIKEKVLALVANHTADDRKVGLSEQSSFETLGFDSLDNVEFVMKAEEEFDLNIPDADAERLLSVGAVVDYLNTQINGVPLPEGALQEPPPIIDTNA